MSQLITQKRRHLERDMLRQSLLLAGIPWSMLAVVLWFVPWYWADKVLLLLLLLLLLVPLALQFQRQLVAVFRSSNNVLESINNGEAELRMGAACGVLADHYRLLNQFADQISSQRLLSTEQQLLLQKVSQHIAVGILAIDSQRRIILMNPAAELLFQTSFDKWRGWPLEQLGVPDGLTGASPRLVKLQIGQQQKQVYLVQEHYLDQGKPHELLFMTDVQQLLYDEERQAWQKLLRVLSHEVNNSLTPICAISQSLHKQLQQQESAPELLSEGLQVINERAQGLNQFMKSYQQLNHLPAPDKKLIALEHMVTTVCGLFNCAVQVQGPPLQLFADPAQLQQVLVNLLKNALEANRQYEAAAVVVSWQPQGKMLHLTVTDEGAGIQNPDNLFVPFYSTKPGGSGIGLVLSRQIARNHGGDLQLSNRTPAAGAQSRLLLPLCLS